MNLVEEGVVIGWLHDAVVPPFVPIQDQRRLVAVSVASEKVPVVQVFSIVEHEPFIGVGTVALKIAVTLVLEEITSVHVPVPEHPPPLHPVKAEPVDGVAVNVTEVPLL